MGSVEDAAELESKEVGEEIPPEPQPYSEIFRAAEKLDAYAMNLDDIGVFEAAGYNREDVGKLSTYGCVLHDGVAKLFDGIAQFAFDGDLFKAVQGKTFLDLGSAEGRCVISASLHFGADVEDRPRLARAVGIELSALRHGLAGRHLARVRDESVRSCVTLVHDDILSEQSAEWISQADIIYVANLHFPEEVNLRLGQVLSERLGFQKEVCILALASLGLMLETGNRGSCSDRAGLARHAVRTGEISVPMSWNPGGWPVQCYHFSPS